jgi:hypothetical protein
MSHPATPPIAHMSTVSTLMGMSSASTRLVRYRRINPTIPLTMSRPRKRPPRVSKNKTTITNSMSTTSSTGCHSIREGSLLRVAPNKKYRPAWHSSSQNTAHLHIHEREGSLLLTIVYGALVIGVVCLAALAGLELVQRHVPANSRQQHNDVADFIYAALGVIYAVLLALVVPGTRPIVCPGGGR